ncbi:minor virion protein [Sputnik virophage 3]|uniref:Minor virion protein n=2 Tax=Mimivirus-dependent virus Sputnik TaxID=1932927 RepID=I0CEQ9_9VIRU|nr:minor virion protein [Sputnik virophage 2]AFH75292.1 minor virion protein [Sputnik virophage 3]AUG85005.1 minor virion protein [Sputnik virophage 2]UMZ08530.1 minor virion protein [Mimivirus-dependent virus Sputnik]3J26_N Chain N, Minor virion protein [Sputnik virophage]
MSYSHSIKDCQEPDTVYYDILIPFKPNDQGFSPAIFQAQLTQPIVHNPSEYFLSVVRFSIPTQNIPLTIPQIQPYPNTNVNNTIYSVSIGYNGTYSSQNFVQFDPSLTSPNIPAPNAPTVTSPNVEVTPYYYIYDYSTFLQMINTALENAFNEISAPVGADAPFFFYDSNTEKISLIAQAAYYDRTLTTPIEIYCNVNLFTFFDSIKHIGLGYNTPTGRDILFDVRFLGNNYYQDPETAPSYPPEFIQMQQEYPTLSNWNAVKTIQLVSNLLPINKESIPSFRNSNVGIINAQGILADFVPLVTNGPEARISIDFVATGPWRLIDMFGSVPIYMVDLYVYWTDQTGGQYLINIPPGRILTCKLVFIKKSLSKYLVSEK